MAQAAVAGQGGSSVAVGQCHTSTSEVTMLMASPTIVIRLGATHSGTRVTNQFQNFCIIGSSMDVHDELYLCSFNFFNSRSLKMFASAKIMLVTAASARDKCSPVYLLRSESSN